MSVVRKLARANRRYGLYTPKIDEFAFIVGAMKSGTTTLYSYLAQHPAIAPNNHQKEPEFFSDAASVSNDLNDYYRQWLPSPFRRQIALEASTGYTKQPQFPNVAERLTRLPEHKHFIYIVRDPVDRIESHMAHNLATGENNLDALFAPENLRHYLAVSQYGRQLDPYRAAFPTLPVKIVDFSDFTHDPLRIVRDICRHLEIDGGFAFRKLPPQNVRRVTGNAEPFRLTAEQRAMLHDALAEDMHRFGQAYHFDVSRWGFDGHDA